MLVMLLILCGSTCDRPKSRVDFTIYAIISIACIIINANVIQHKGTSTDLSDVVEPSENLLSESCTEVLGLINLSNENDDEDDAGSNENDDEDTDHVKARSAVKALPSAQACLVCGNQSCFFIFPRFAWYMPSKPLFIILS